MQHKHHARARFNPLARRSPPFTFVEFSSGIKIKE
jgi:hypothetical protein